MVTVQIKCDQCGEVLDVSVQNYWKLDAEKVFYTINEELVDESQMNHAPYHFCSLAHLHLWLEEPSE